MREKDFHRELDAIKELLGQRMPGKKKTSQLDRMERKLDKVLAFLKNLPVGPDDPRLAEATESLKQNKEKLEEAITTNTDPEVPDPTPVP
jgi:hypothetical protein